MTLVRDRENTCALCGQQSLFPTVVSMYSSEGDHKDLDLRPPKRNQWTIMAWVQRCPRCGHCAQAVDQPRPNAGQVITTLPYRCQLDKPENPELTNSFLCQAMIEEAGNELAAACTSTLSAAWACDDAGRGDRATACRLAALSLLDLAEAAGFTHAHPDTLTALRVDLLRRANRLDEAKRLLAGWRPRGPDEITRRVLEYEKKLIRRGDLSAHEAGEALGLLPYREWSWSPRAPRPDRLRRCLEVLGRILWPWRN